MSQPLVSSPPSKTGFLRQALPEWRALAILGGPILVAQLAQMANSVIDTIMAGHASAEDLAGVGIGSSLWVPLVLFSMGVLSAMQPMISGYKGARQPRRIMPVTWQGIYISQAAALGMILLVINAGPLLALFQLEPDTRAITEGYLKALAWGLPAIMLLGALRGLTDGLGHTRVIMLFSLLATLINLPLNYIFIYGKLGVPAFGGVGCGWATTLSHWLALIGLLLYLNSSKIYRRYHLLVWRTPPQWAVMRQVLRLGLPIGGALFVEVSMFSVIALFLAPLGATVVAGHQVVLNVVSLMFMVPLSLGMALTLRVSYLLGAGHPETARALARSSMLLALGVAALYAPALLFGRNLIAQLYTNDPAVIEVALTLMVFAAAFQVADVLQVAAIHALRGYRDTRIPMFIMLLSFWGICLPLGYLLTFTELLGPALGAPGFWIALTTGLALASVLLGWRLWLVTRATGRAAAGTATKH
ncbi:MATE family efflux transporter [Marinimicrobium alkaliphilum]|uniref:MATE family efflux transporter n=1 Tax=Marinimicrobium alkaliphilum TaxID=2202654 RepID=UPI000DBAD691|nr:MATE family efflux transporter [Marinimicrobium alkaliphilum]